MMAKRVAFLHTGAVVIAPIQALAAQHLPGVEVLNLLDDRIVADLGNARARDSVPHRLHHLVGAAALAGADAVMLTCSSISGFAAELSQAAGIRVLQIDEAMADMAVAAGQQIAVIATLETTCGPTAALLRQRAQLAGRTVDLESVVVPDAFAAVASGDRQRHDALVAAAIEEAALRADVVVLAQASMASAAQAVQVTVPVLTSLELGIKRLATQL